MGQFVKLLVPGGQCVSRWRSCML